VSSMSDATLSVDILTDALSLSCVSTNWLARGCLVTLNQRVQAGGSDTAGSFADLDQDQLPFINESVDRRSGYAEFGFRNVYAIKQCVVRRARGHATVP